MPITPGKCPPSGCPPVTQKDCIEVFKVYDQCVAEEILGSCVRAADFCAAPIPADAVIACTVVPNSAVCFFTGFGDFNPPFFRPVRVLQRVQVSVTVSVGGVVVCGPFTITLQTVTQALLWAPPGTFVQCQILAVGDCSCDLATDPVTGDQLICCRVKVCKDIQVKALVKLLVPSYGFCELEPCVAAPQPEFPCPPEPVFPPQLCQEPPVFTLLSELGVGIGGVTVNLTRKTDSTTVTISKVTAANGQASFAEIGGFAGSLDDISFVDPATGKTVTFHVPVEFVDTGGVARDSATACVIQFQRTALGANTFNVTIDGFTLQSPVDP
ncbi:MAG: hypothetical protein ACPLQO_09945 [Desulfotomaculales bacterium]